MLSIAVSANKPVRDVTEYADKILRRQLESITGVGQVLVLGGRQRQINVWLDADRLRAYNLTVTDVSRALQSQNIEIPGGRVDQGAHSVTLRTRGRVQTVAEFSDIVVREKDGHPMRVGDVARVEDGEAEPTTIANVDGEATVLLQIRRQSGTNTVEVVNGVKEKLAELQATLPAGYNARVVRDLGEFIEASIHDVEEHLVVGSILAALVVLLFLWNLRSTLIAAIAIPTSIIATFGLIWYMGFTLNAMTMLALTLAVGIVIDDAIVVLENIYRFIEEKSVDPVTAAIEATKEIGLAVLATTLSLVAIFVPVGVHGRHRRPVHEELRPDDGVRDHGVAAGELHADADDGGAVAEGRPRPRPSSTPRRTRGSSTPSTSLYTRMLEWSMAHRAIVAGVAVLVLLSSVPLFMVRQQELHVRTTTSRSSRSTCARRRARASSRPKSSPTGSPTRSAAGSRKWTTRWSRSAAIQSATRNLATIYVRLTPIEERTRDQFAVMGVVRDEILPPLAAGPADIGAAGGDDRRRRLAERRRPVPDQRTRSEEARGDRPPDARGRQEDAPGVVDVDTSLNVGKPELSVQLDRPKAADLGVQIGDAAEALRLLVGGDQVTTYNEGSEQYEVHLRARAENRSTDRGHRRADGPVDAAGQRAARQRGAVQPRHGAVRHQPARPAAPGDRLRQPAARRHRRPRCRTAIQAEFDRLNPGADYRGGFTGRSKELGRAAQNFVLAFVLSLVFMYLILAAQFESWLHPITILLSLPLTLPFALLSIIIFGQSLNIFSALGLLVLFGVVKKNSILQIDHANQLKALGLSHAATPSSRPAATGCVRF